MASPSIRPGETVRAPCDGTVALTAKHGVTIRAANGAEILIHVGIETVALKGEGFRSHVADGATVKAGDTLLSFDLDLLATKAKSLLSPVVVANGDAFRILRRSANRETKAGEFLMEIEPAGEVSAEVAPSSGASVRRNLTIGLAHGIHARPAAAIAAAAKMFSSEIAFEAGAKRANAKSTVALMTMGLTNGDTVSVVATGADALQAVGEITRLLEEELPAHPEESVVAPAVQVAPARAARPGTLRGVTASQA